MIEHPNDAIKSCFLRAVPSWPAALMELTRTVRAVGFGRARLDHGPGEIQCLASVAFSPSEFYYLRKVHARVVLPYLCTGLGIQRVVAPVPGPCK